MSWASQMIEDGDVDRDGYSDHLDSGGWGGPGRPRSVDPDAWLALFRRHAGLPHPVRDARLRWSDADVSPLGWSMGAGHAPSGIRVVWEIPDPIPTWIDDDYLRSLGACSQQRVLFAATFPDGAALTAANLRVARRAGLNVAWLAKKLRIPVRRLAVAA